MNYILPILLAVAAGCGLSLQAGINGGLRSATGSGVWAAFVSFAIGTVALFCFSLPIKSHWPSTAAVYAAPWWVWTGGFIGAAYVYSTIVVAPRLGATTFFGIVIAGQVITSLFFDHYGLLGFPLHRVSGMRMVGVTLLIAGAYLVRKF